MGPKRSTNPPAAVPAKRARTSGRDFESAANRDGSTASVATDSEAENQVAVPKKVRGIIARAKKARDDGVHETRVGAAYIRGAEFVLGKIENSGKEGGMPKVVDVSDAELDTMLAASAEERAWWSEDDERNLQVSWTDRSKISGTEPHQIANMSEDQVKNARHFWKPFLKFYRRLPTDIFTTTTRLRAEISQAAGSQAAGGADAERVPYPVFWTRQFYSCLEEIMWHPIFARRLDRLVLVLQFVAIAATDDRGTWQFRNPTWDSFLDGLRAEIDTDAALQPKDRRSVIDMCREVNGRFPDRTPSPFFRLFEMISTDKRYPTRGKRAAPGARKYRNFAETPRTIYTEDLRALTHHLANLGFHTAYPSASTMEMYKIAYCYDDAILRTTAPSGKEAVPNALKGAMLRHERTEMIDERRAAGPVPLPAASLAPGARLPGPAIPPTTNGASASLALSAASQRFPTPQLPITAATPHLPPVTRHQHVITASPRLRTPQATNIADASMGPRTPPSVVSSDPQHSSPARVSPAGLSQSPRPRTDVIPPTAARRSPDEQDDLMAMSATAISEDLDDEHGTEEVARPALNAWLSLTAAPKKMPARPPLNSWLPLTAAAKTVPAPVPTPSPGPSTPPSSRRWAVKPERRPPPPSS